MKALVINANREGYSLDQLWSTMTVRQMISILETVRDKDLPVVVGNDRTYDGWYTFGSINEEDFDEYEEEDEEEEEELPDEEEGEEE